jgi:hypothetical protein
MYSGRKVVFVHIPKAAGTTVHQLLLKHFPREQICDQRFNTLKDASPETLSPFRLFSGHYDWTSVRQITGNPFIFTLLRDPEERILSLYYFWRSHRWDYIKAANLAAPSYAKERNLLDFLSSDAGPIVSNIDNKLTRVFAGEYNNPRRGFGMSDESAVDLACRRLDSLDFVGFQHDMQASVSALFRRLGLPAPKNVHVARRFADLPKNPKLEPVEREEITDEIAAQLRRLTTRDRQVYRHALNSASSPQSGFLHSGPGVAGSPDSISPTPSHH